MKNEKLVLGMPKWVAYGILLAAIAGILIGSFADLNVSQMLANKTPLSSFMAHYESYIAYCLYPAAGMCLYTGLKAKGRRYHTLGLALAILSYCLAVYYMNNYYGSYLREDFGYVDGVSSIWLGFGTLFFWAVAFIWVPIVFHFILSDDKPDILIAIGLIILVGGIVGDNINTMLKELNSRPRYRYLLEDSSVAYRPWWEFVPYSNVSGEFESWPSGHLTKACILLCLPMFADVCKFRSKALRWTLIIVAILLVLYVGYNRIQTEAHFLSDVCFGIFLTYGTYLITYHVASKTLETDF